MTRIANRMQEAVNRLSDRFDAVASIVITYAQGAKVITGVVATVGRTPFDVMAGDVMTAYESRPYFIKSSRLIYNGVQLMPLSGDIVTEADGRTYEVSIPKGINLFETIGPAGTEFKINTKAMS